MAYAPPNSSDGAFDPPPGWQPQNMPRAEVAAYVPPPSEPPQLPAPPPAPAPARSWTAAPVPLPPEPPVEVAALPEPPPPPAPRVQTAAAFEAPASAAPQRHQGFRLVAPAMAAPAPVYRGSPGEWAIQVGAFGNEGLAHIAVGQAREQAGSVVAAARPSVASVKEPHGTLYRARLIGLSRDAASEACERLRGRTGCIVLSPAAQS
jgi:hypothetical protein